MINMVTDDTMLTYCDNVRFFLWLSRVFRKGHLHTKNYCLSIVTVAISTRESFTRDCKLCLYKGTLYCRFHRYSFDNNSGNFEVEVKLIY